MTNFNGITPKAIELLSENRFNDSKAFYEEHKEELKQLATIPMRQIVLDLAEMMTELDDKMYTDPVYTVSRIRRDTRRSKSKMMYRENLWLMLRRHKKQYPCAPFFWFEFSPVCYTMGLGFFVQKPAQFDELRKVIWLTRASGRVQSNRQKTQVCTLPAITATKKTGCRMHPRRCSPI